MSLGAGFDVFQTETKEVMPFDDVRVAPLNFVHQLLKHLSFIKFLARDQPLPAR